MALRLISERESEIEKFIPQEYWSLEADFTTRQGGIMTSRMTHFEGEKLNRFSLANAETANRAADAVRTGDFRVASIERKSTFRNPQPPFTTSTLQQEASRKLGFGTARTMRIAQRLYEGVDIGGETVGLITYMRTDSISMAQEAVTGSRNLIRDQFGPDYVPDTPNVFPQSIKECSGGS